MADIPKESDLEPKPPIEKVETVSEREQPIEDKLFSSVKFVLGRCIDSDNVKQILLANGATLIHYLSEIVTHVIADYSNCPVAEEAVDIFEKTVVNSSWVLLSIKTKKILPIWAYSPFNNIFNGVIASFSSSLSQNDAKALASAITFYGGKVTRTIDVCTHFIVTKDDEIDLPKDDKVRIVTPDWVLDSIKDKTVCKEVSYHPSLLDYPPPKIPTPPPPILQEKNLNEKKLVTSTPPAPILKSSQSIAKEFSFKNCCFKLIEYDSVPTKVKRSWLLAIKNNGGHLHEELLKVTHLICETRFTDTYRDAIKNGVRCITINWINDVIAKRQLIDPWKPLHFPLSFSPENKPLKNHIITVTNFEGPERKAVKDLILLAGAKYTNYMSFQNTLLVCRNVAGNKYDKAIQWKIPIVNCHFLNDIILNPSANQTTMLSQSRYQLFHYDDPFKLTGYFDCQELIEAWKRPLNEIYVSNSLTNGASEDSGMANSTPNSEIESCPVIPEKTLLIENGKIETTNRIIRESHEQVFALFTHFESSKLEKLKLLCANLNISVTDEACECTHLITDGIFRTSKFICAFSHARYILTSEWITESYGFGKLLKEDSYSLKDTKGEEKYCFDLDFSLIRRNKRQSLLFKDMTFFVTPGVKPNVNTISQMIESAGGTVATKKPPSKDQIEQMRSDGKDIIAVCCLNDRHLCQGLVALNVDVVTTEFVMSGILRQEVDINAHRLIPIKQKRRIETVDSLNHNPTKRLRTEDKLCQ